MQKKSRLMNIPMFTTKLLFLTVFFCSGIKPVFSAVHGPVAFEILGYDSKLKVVFFTRTDWGSCDCETDLYSYYPDRDSMAITYSWCKRNEFAKDKSSVIKKKGFAQLVKLNPISNPNQSIYKFTWLPRENEFGIISPSNADKFPFQLEIGKVVYQFVQCFSNSINPRIKQFRISENSSFVLMTFKGDCTQGNTRDVLIICTKTNGLLLSREVN
jgi:hypothetical protein